MMQKMFDSIIDEYKETVARLRKECTEKTDAIILLGEQLRSVLQEMISLQDIPQVEEALTDEDKESIKSVSNVLKRAREALVKSQQERENLLEEVLECVGVSVYYWHMDKDRVKEILGKYKEKIRNEFSNY